MARKFELKQTPALGISQYFPTNNMAVAISSALALEKIPLSPPRWREVLQHLLNSYNSSHALLAKSVSYKTMQERRVFYYAFFRELRGLDYWIDPRSLGNRHVTIAVQAWIDRGCAPSTLQQYLSHLRVLCQWIGKPGMIPKDLSKITSVPERFTRTFVARKDLSWEASGASPAAAICAADGIDAYVGAQLRMQHAFGLRVKESILFQPHNSLVSAEGAGIDDPSAPPCLRTLRGTKGGRLRFLPIDNDQKREAFAHAQALVHGATQSLGDPKRTLVQAYARFHYVMKRLGVTKKKLGVTAHGLRHGFAAVEFEKRAGVEAPVRGGCAGDPEQVEAARLAVAQQLGHSRTQITSAYLGRSPAESAEVDHEK